MYIEIKINKENYYSIIGSPVSEDAYAGRDRIKNIWWILRNFETTH